MKGVYWCSLDPINCAINFYPKIIAERLEKDYISGSEKTELGADFFDATVYYNNSILYQTTKGQYGRSCRGRYGGQGYIKHPGFRCVKRIEILNHDKNNIINYTFYNIYKTQHQWRFTNEVSQYERTITGEVPEDVIIYPNTSNNIVKTVKTINRWNHTMLNDDYIDKSQSIVVWQWCKKTCSNYDNLYNLNDDSWCPYLYEQNNIIEDAFTNNKNDVEIILPFDNTMRIISFNRNSCYANQVDSNKTKNRLVRRKIITLQSLIDYFDNSTFKYTQNSHEIIDELYNSTTIPSEFYCPITQNIMVEPVKTCDGHVYDKEAIQKWFDYKNTSPLTNLILSTLMLEPYDALYNTINKFIQDKPELFN